MLEFILSPKPPDMTCTQSPDTRTGVDFGVGAGVGAGVGVGVGTGVGVGGVGVSAGAGIADGLAQAPSKITPIARVNNFLISASSPHRSQLRV